MILKKLDILFIENVGNLICPVGFDLGESSRLLLSSVSEGDDKPVKYPKAFVKTDLVILNKTDMLPYSDFNNDFFTGKIKELNPEIEIIRLSCKNGQGIEGWIDWIEKNIQCQKK